MGTERAAQLVAVDSKSTLVERHSLLFHMLYQVKLVLIVRNVAYQTKLTK